MTSSSPAHDSSNEQERRRRSFGKVVVPFVILLLMATLQLYEESPYSICDSVFSLGGGVGLDGAEKLPLQEREACNLENLSFFKSLNATDGGRANQISVDPDSVKCYLDAHRRWAPEEKVLSATVEFEIKECPPGYHQSNFQLESTNTYSRMMGHVGRRNLIRDGCGIYRATIPVLPSTTAPSKVQLWWTSDQGGNANRISDVENVHKLFQSQASPDFTQEKLLELVHPDRLEFLEVHLDDLGGFQLEWNKTDTRIPIDGDFDRSSLPYCSDVPMKEWTPAGVFGDPRSVHGVFSFFDNGQATNTTRWPLGFAGCNIKRWTSEELNKELAGIRIRLMLDSNGQKTKDQWIPRICPGINPSEMFDKHKDDCPLEEPTRASWMITWRFFRGIFTTPEAQNDHDGISKAMRLAQEDACQKWLGLGLFNVTVIGAPSWLYVYETNEGLENYLTSMESLFRLCKERSPDLFERHMFLLQTSTAVDSYARPADIFTWRGIQNYRIEAFTEAFVKQIGPYTDGIIPVFETTYARMVYPERTRDGVHHKGYTYNEMFDMMISGIVTTLRSRGMGRYAANASDENLRWWENVGLAG